MKKILTEKRRIRVDARQQERKRRTERRGFQCICPSPTDKNFKQVKLTKSVFIQFQTH